MSTVKQDAEPVAWRVRRHDLPNYWIVFLHKPVDALQDPEREVQPLYASPPKREPLTDEQINAIARDSRGLLSGELYPLLFARRIERAHGIGDE